MRRTFQIAFSTALLLGLAACEQAPRSGPIAQPPTSQVEPESVDDALYVLHSPTTPIAVGAEQVVALQIRPAPGWKINKLYDWKLEFEQPASARIVDTEIAGDEIQLDDASATIPVTLTATAEGPVELAASADFSVCTDEKCELYKDVPLQFAVSATRPSP